MYSSNTVQRTEWYAKLITTPFPINCEAPTSMNYMNTSTWAIHGSYIILRVQQYQQVVLPGTSTLYR